MGLFGAVSCSPNEGCPPVGFPKAQVDRSSAENGERETTGRETTVGETLQRLRSSVQALECGPNGLEPRASSAALRKLADALASHADWSTPALQRLLRAAKNLDTLSSGPTDRGKAASSETVSKVEEGRSTEMVRGGLEAAQQTLLAQTGPVKYQGAVSQLGYSLAAMRAENDLVERCQSAIRAFRGATDAVFVGLDGTPPFGDPIPNEAAPLAFTSMLAGIEPARAVVASLGNAHWQRASDTAAEALRLFAATLSAADCHQTLESNTSSLRFQAERLTQSYALSFEKSRWVKQGLSAALDALDALDDNDQVLLGARKQTEPDQFVAAVPWKQAARAAVATIDPDRLFGLQRAPIQDGFRATLDALALAAESAPACQR